MKAIQITEHGGPEVLTLTEVPDPVAGPDQLLVTTTAAGVNFADTLAVADAYPPRRTPLPFIPGSEVIGRAADGRRVMGQTEDGYAEQALLDRDQLVEVPDEVSDGAALALLVQGLTAYHTLVDSARIREGDRVLVQSGAGGVGSLAIQLARHLGASHVVATASTDQKRAQVLSLGADAAVDSTSTTLEADLRAASLGGGYDIVLESVGGEVFEISMRVLDPFGRVIAFGSAGGAPAPSVNPSALFASATGVMGFWAGRTYARGAITHTVPLLLELTRSGVITPLVHEPFPLVEAARCHTELAQRRTTGKLTLVP